MANYQHCGLGGNLTQDVKVISPQVAKFSIAINSGYGENKKTTFINCVMFAKRFGAGGAWAMLTSLKKGTNVGLSGEFNTNSYTDKEGVKKSNLEFIVGQMQVYSSKPKEDGSETSEKATSKSAPVDDAGEDDQIPF